MKKQQKRMKLKRKGAWDKGITLIALVVTIIVLLILAGVTIATLTGENGIIKRASEASEKTIKAGLEEKIKLLIAEIMIDQYSNETNTEVTPEEIQNKLETKGENVLVVQWEQYIIFDLNTNKEYRVMSDGSVEYWGESNIGKVLKETKTANAEQIDWDSTSNNVIGIDNAGNTVNMLRWEYTLIEDETLGKIGTYGLNDVQALKQTIRSAGYKESYEKAGETISNYNDNGTIKGTVPAYISTDGGNSYSTVTSMVHTFYACANLVTAPELPNTVTNIEVCFYKTSSLKNAPRKIPDSVVNARHALRETGITIAPILGKRTKDITSMFYGCTELVAVQEIPDGVINMQNAFQGCTALVTAPEIPNSVTNMQSTFQGCTALVTAPKVSNSVTNMQSTFQDCTALVTAPEIPDSVTDMKATFFNCTALETPPSIIPNTVNNMMQTFYHCSSLQGTIQINANLTGKVVLNWNNKDYKDYTNCFIAACINGTGLTILKSSTCPTEMLNNLIAGNSKIQIEQ